MYKSLGVCSWSLQPISFVDLIHKVQRCGLCHVQLALDPINTEGWELDLGQKLLSEAQIQISSGMMTTIGEDYSTLDSIRMSGGIRPDEFWDQNVQRAHKNAESASQLGLDLVSFHAGFIPEGDPQERSVMIDRIQHIAEIFGNKGIGLALETGQENAQTLEQLLADDRLNGVGVNFDPANMILYGMGNPASAIKLLQDHIVQVHMKDAIPPLAEGRWGTEVTAGSGDVDWEDFFRVVQSMPQAVDVLIEREAGDSRVEDITIARTVAESLGCLA